MKTATVFGSLLLAAALGAPALAQDPGPSPTPKPVTGTAQVSFLQTRGNTDTSVFGLGAEIKYKGASPWSVGAKGFFNRGSVNGNENLKNLAAAARAGRSLDSRTDLFLEAAYAEDEYAGIDHRVAGELGVARKLTVDGPHLFSLEVGFGLAHEVRLPGKIAQDFGFGRGGLAYKWLISKTADFQNQDNYIANLKQSSDWRFTNVAALTAAIGGKFSLKLIHTVNHLNTPPPGKKKTDTIIAAALVAKF